MATQLFFLTLAIPADTHRGTNTAKRDGTASGWTTGSLTTARGSSLGDTGVTNTVTGPTNGVELTFNGFPIEWLSPPVAADVTISGTITANLWAREVNMADNVAINVIVDIVRSSTSGADASNTIVNIVQSTRVIELTNAAAGGETLNNFTTGMASGGYTGQTLNRGDRLRVRVVGDDVGTMASGGLFYMRVGSSTAAVNGDSYVTFTENITFENPPGVLAQTSHPINLGVTGPSVINQHLAQPFVAQDTLTEVRLWLRKVGAPADLTIEIQSDSSGSPSGSSVGTVATVTAASVTTTSTEYTYACSVSLTPSTTYWLVVRGTYDGSNYFNVATSDSAVSGWTEYKQWSGSVWNTATAGTGQARCAAVRLTFASTTTLYLTDTASAVSTASVDKEAWTSRGSGVVTKSRNGVAGWTVPLQFTDGVGGTEIDWFTRPLTAFTLTGMAVANIRMNQFALTGNISARVEIARVEGDGTSPTVWSSWCVTPITTDNGELATAEAAQTFNLSGDDLAISNGQRLRLRVYLEDMSSAAMSGGTAYLYYAGTSGGASGDTYITFPQTLTEYSGGGPATGDTPRRRLAAHRFLTVR